MLLILRVLAVINHKIIADARSTAAAAAASAPLLDVLASFMHDLANIEEDLGDLPTAELLRVDNSLLVGIAEQAMHSLRQVIKCIPGSASLFFDILLQILGLSDSPQGIAEVIIAQGANTVLPVHTTLHSIQRGKL